MTNSLRKFLDFCRVHCLLFDLVCMNVKGGFETRVRPPSNPHPFLERVVRQAPGELKGGIVGILSLLTTSRL